MYDTHCVCYTHSMREALDVQFVTWAILVGRTEGGPPMRKATDLVEFETMLITRHAYAQTRRPDAADHLLERSAYLLLTRIQLAGPVSIGQLSDALDLDVSTLNRQTAAMMRAGLVERMSDPEGGMARKFVLSAEGASRIAAHRTSITRSLDGILEDWTPAEVAEFARALKRFNQDIERRQGQVWPRPHRLSATDSPT